MRVISGSARGIRLKMVPGDSTRPILDRVKENLFNIISTWVPGSSWLDLFAGTGQVGIEALSRGAESALFTDLDRHAIRTIHKNLEVTRLKDKATVRRENALTMLERPPAEGMGFEFIFVAPPQYKNLWQQALQTIDANPTWLQPEGVVIVQIDPDELSEVTLQTLELFDKRHYGRTLLQFYERPGE